jgi:hypothetical protein
LSNLSQPRTQAEKVPVPFVFRMWESLEIRQLGVLENVGSNPTILTEFAS